jgi:parallel beta-helix repeat protein
VWDGLDRGIYVAGGASPSVADNTITTNALGAIHVDADGHPKIGQNVVSPGLTTRYLDRFRSGS